jgi:hypothetical protein
MDAAGLGLAISDCKEHWFAVNLRTQTDLKFCIYFKDVKWNHHHQ